MTTEKNPPTLNLSGVWVDGRGGKDTSWELVPNLLTRTANNVATDYDPVELSTGVFLSLSTPAEYRRGRGPNLINKPTFCTRLWGLLMKCRHSPEVFPCMAVDVTLYEPRCQPLDSPKTPGGTLTTPALRFYKFFLFPTQKLPPTILKKSINSLPFQLYTSRFSSTTWRCAIVV